MLPIQVGLNGLTLPFPPLAIMPLGTSIYVLSVAISRQSETKLATPRIHSVLHKYLMNMYYYVYTLLLPETIL